MLSSALLRKSVLVLFSFALFSASHAQTDKSKQIDELIAPFAADGYFSGVVVASEDGKVIYEKAFGLANADFSIPNQIDTRIGIASITKYMTTVILGRLLDEKKIALTDKLSKYIPEFPNGENITIEMLAIHRSGIPHRVMPPEQEAVPHPIGEMVRRIAEAKPDFEPGTRRGYSSAGYTVLARAMEIASGKRYAELLRQYVFEPAGMRDSLDFDGEEIIKRRAQDYLLKPNGYVNAALKDYSFLIGAGSVFSTAGDVCKFGNAVISGTYGETATSRLVNDGVLSGSGRTNGHRAYLEFDSKSGFGFVLLSNLSSGAFDIISTDLTDIMKGRELSVKNFKVPKLAPDANKDLSEFAGRYPRTDGGTFQIVLKDGVLYSGDIGIYPVGKDCFFDYSFFGSVCFSRNEGGDVAGITWKGAGFELVGKKE